MRFFPSITLNAKWIGVGSALLIFLTLIVYFFPSKKAPEGGTLIIGRDNTWFPLDLRGREMNMVGFSNDLLDAFAALVGVESRVVELGPSQLFFALERGDVEAVFSSIDQTLANQQRFLFSDPIYSLGLVLVVRSDSDIAKVEDIDGRILGIESGALQVYNLPERPSTVIIPYDTLLTALEKLEDNQIDAVLVDSLRANIFIQAHYRGKLKVGTAPLTERAIRFVTMRSPSGEQLISRFNHLLKILKSNGMYREMINKWNLVPTEE